MPAERLRLLTFNIGGPSAERATRQLAWLASRPEHVFALTETTPAPGSALIADRFEQAGYRVHYPVPDKGERGAMIVSRLPLDPAPAPTGAVLPFRAAAATVKAAGEAVEITGVYVPSRDASEAKTARKVRFIEALQQGLPAADEGVRVVLGDLNVLETEHVPHYRTFLPFEYGLYQWLTANGYLDAYRAQHRDQLEYSWVGRTGDGYRYDHAHTNAAVQACDYVHAPRTELGLSDHSALTLELALPAGEPLPVPDPAATSHATLF